MGLSRIMNSSIHLLFLLGQLQLYNSQHKLPSSLASLPPNVCFNTRLHLPPLQPLHRFTPSQSTSLVPEQQLAHSQIASLTSSIRDASSQILSASLTIMVYAGACFSKFLARRCRVAPSARDLLAVALLSVVIFFSRSSRR
jgi:hypothetical protein